MAKLCVSALQAATRGDGKEGEDVSHNAHVIAGVPQASGGRGCAREGGEGQLARRQRERVLPLGSLWAALHMHSGWPAGVLLSRFSPSPSSSHWRQPSVGREGLSGRVPGRSLHPTPNSLHHAPTLSVQVLRPPAGQALPPVVEVRGEVYMTQADLQQVRPRAMG